MLHYPDDSESMTVILIIVAWHILHFQKQCSPEQCPEGATNVQKCVPHFMYAEHF